MHIVSIDTNGASILCVFADLDSIEACDGFVYNGLCWLLNHEEMSWFMARDACMTGGGDLAAFRDSHITAMINQYLQEYARTFTETNQTISGFTDGERGSCPPQLSPFNWLSLLSSLSTLT